MRPIRAYAELACVPLWSTALLVDCYGVCILFKIVVNVGYSVVFTSVGFDGDDSVPAGGDSFGAASEFVIGLDHINVYQKIIRTKSDSLLVGDNSQIVSLEFLISIAQSTVCPGVLWIE